jgi:membrane fusion protein (multidrug efflux system)
MHSNGPLRERLQDPLVTSTASINQGVEYTDSKLCWRNGPTSVSSNIAVGIKFSRRELGSKLLNKPMTIHPLHIETRRKARFRFSATYSYCALLVAIVAPGLCGCKKAATPLPPPVVMVMDVTATNAPVFTEIIGQLDSPQNVEIRARVEGFVDKMLFTEGTEIKESDPLFKLDDKPYKERLAAADGVLAEARASLNKYDKDVARLRPLAEKRAVPQQDLDNALASVEVGKASVLSAQAQVDAAKLDLGYCDVHAPISGLIGAKQVSIGDFVGKGQPTLLVTMSTLDPIWFYCAVSEVEYLKAEGEARRTGKQVSQLPVTLILTDGSVHPDNGKFVFIDRAVDIKTATLKVRAEFPNTAKILRPGMFARIKVDLGVRTNSILVPERAVAELQGKNFVWLIGADSKATQRAVQLGETLGSNVRVSEGLKIGDRIVVEGIQKVREGAEVKAMTAAEFASAAQAAKQAEAKPAKE